MNIKKLKMLNLLLVSVIIFSLFATVAIAKDATKDATLDKILKEGVVKVGFCVDVPPYKFKDKNNEVVGICADLSKAMARDLGVKLEYVFSDWGGLIPNLLSGRSDVVIGDMSVTVARAKKVIFSDPWWSGPASTLVVRNDSEWKTVKDLNKEGLKIGCILGARGEKMIKTFLPKATPMVYNSNTEQILALKQGRLDAAVNSFTIIKGDVDKSKGLLRLIPEPLEMTTAIVTFRPDDYRFLLWANNWLFCMKRSGELPKLINYWIDTYEWKKDYPSFGE